MVALRVAVGAWWWWGDHGWAVVRCGLHGVALDDQWRPWVSCEVCELHVGERVRVRCAWVSSVGFVSVWKGGAGYMWWCGGRVWAGREVWAACGGHGGHGVHVDYLWAMCVRNGCGWAEFGGCMEIFFGATSCGMASMAASGCFLFHFDANFRKNK